MSIRLVVGILCLAQFTAAVNHTECRVYKTNGDCELLCRKAAWTDVAVFFIGNYVAHAATIVTLPGQSTALTIAQVLAALIFPGAGIWKGTRAVASLAIFAPSDLQMACRASALCIVVARTFMSTKLHGRRNLSTEEILVALPRRCAFKEDEDESEPSSSLMERMKKAIVSQFTRTDETSTRIACSYNIVKSLVALGQLIFAVSTLYRARGTQVDRFGYAAFGLTVTPYAWMSFINLVGNLVCPSYPTMFIVEGEYLQTVRARYGYHFLVDGTAGRISEADEHACKSDRDFFKKPFESERDIRLIAVSVILGCAPFAIVGGISKFHHGHSELYQRVWLLLWLCGGTIFGPTIFYVVEPYMEPRVVLNREHQGKHMDCIIFVLMAAVSAVPAIGGFVVVAREIMDYGVCFRL